MSTNSSPAILTVVLFTLAACFTAVRAEPTDQANTNSNQEAVIAVLQEYKTALQNLTTDDTFKLFTSDSRVFEQGGVEGDYPHYVKHHLGPELGHFERFSFSDYNADIEIDGKYAFATETYHYTIVTKVSDARPSRTIEKQGLATSVLVKTDAGWRIKRTHSSSRTPKNKK